MRLTNYPYGSLRELLKISFPLMLSSFSMMFMIFVDRALLSHYSQDAFNAVVTSSTLAWSFTVCTLAIASIAEVFVAQNNGARRFEALGEPVWQMIWFGVASFALYLPLSFFGVDYIYGLDRPLEKDYFSWMVLFAPFYAIYGGVSSYFIGQGRTTLISVLAVVANFINLFLDFIFIFGIEGYFPSMGIRGAAIATSLSQVIQVAVLFFFFLRKKERDAFGTGEFRWKMKPFLQCLKIGLPGGVASFLEIGGWAVFYEMMTKLGPDYIMTAGVCQSLIILLFFFPEGMMKGVTAIAGNFIGARQTSYVPKTIRSGIYASLLFIGTLLLCSPLWMDLVIREFLDQVPLSVLDNVMVPLRLGIVFVLLYLFFDGIRFLYYGVLMAAGDTLYLLYAGFASVWAFLVLPTYFLAYYQEPSLVFALSIPAIYAFLTLFVFVFRYLQGGWRSINIHGAQEACSSS